MSTQTYILFDGLLQDGVAARKAICRAIVDVMTVTPDDVVECIAGDDVKPDHSPSWVVTAHPVGGRMLYLAYWTDRDWAQKAFSSNELVQKIRSLRASPSGEDATENGNPS